VAAGVKGNDTLLLKAYGKAVVEGDGTVALTATSASTLAQLEPWTRKEKPTV
jgi:hypothetical protein